MRSSATAQVRHFHGMLILLPTGLLATAVLLDLVDLATGTHAFAVAAYWVLAGGVVAALMAGPLALMGWLQLPARSSARRRGTLNGGCIAVILFLFVGSWLLRDAQGGVPLAALALSFAAAIVSVLTPCMGAVLDSRTDPGVRDRAEGDSSLMNDEPPAGPSARVD